jgi:hypothetical protein
MWVGPAETQESGRPSIAQARADAVRAAVLDGGPDPSRVTAVGYGERYPIAENDTEAGRARNRRVELHTAPPGARPPRPEGAGEQVGVRHELIGSIAPAPREVPAPRGSFCDQLRALGSAVPDLTGASCRASTPGWICTFDLWATELARRVEDCVGGARDGDALYVTLPSGTLAVEPDPTAELPSGRIRFTPR